jgi:hypothetical protein
MRTLRLLVVVATVLALAAGTSEARGPITKQQAARTVRQAASEFLTMTGLPFQVRPRDWRVRCRRAERWVCRVRQGPCSGRFRVIRATLGGQLRGVGRVTCVAD